MIDETFAQIKARIKAADKIGSEAQDELLGLLDKLDTEIDSLAETKADHAASISGFAKLSAREATRSEPNPDLMQKAVDGLSTSVKEFEVSHPRLSEVANSICMMLSNIGI